MENIEAYKNTSHVEKQRVLLVEDVDAYRYLLARELGSLGYEVIAFQLAMEALNHIDLDPDIKLAVLDIRMPANTLTGLALARMMRYRDMGGNVILMTSHSGLVDLPETEPFGVVLLKTHDITALALAIHERLAVQ
jgi:DNA-binding NtrC family response regulator